MSYKRPFSLGLFGLDLGRPSVAPSGPPTPNAPLAPATYTVPGGATACSTAAQLITALAAGPVVNIVLTGASYDNSVPFQNPNSCSVYAQSLGSATLTAALQMGGNSGAGGGIVQGINFDIASAAKASDVGLNAAVMGWGNSAKNVQVLDCTFNGHNVIQQAYTNLSPGGSKAQRLVINNFTAEGIRLSDNTTVAYHASTPAIDTVSDINVNTVCATTTLTADPGIGGTTLAVTTGAGTVNGNYVRVGSEWMLITAGGGTNSFTVARAQLSTVAAAHSIGTIVFLPGASLGTAESGLFIGHPVTNSVSRIKVRNVSWSGIETANNSWDTIFTDLDIDMSGIQPGASEGNVGFYMEHFSIKNTLTKFKIVGTRLGIDSEWDDLGSTDYLGSTNTFASTTVTTGFTQPAVGSSVSVALGLTTGLSAFVGVATPYGAVFISGGGSYDVVSVTDGTHVVLKNLGLVNGLGVGGTVSAANTVKSAIAAGHRNIIQNGVISSVGTNDATITHVGVFCDEGTESPTVTGVTFIGQNFAGIANFNNIGNNPVNTGNNYASVLSAGGVATTTIHP